MNWVTLEQVNALAFAADPVPGAKLQRWCREGALPARKFGGEWRVDLDAMQAPAAQRRSLDVKDLVLDKLRPK